MKLVVGITGSTGVIYGIRLLEVLKEKGIETNLVMSEWAKKCVPMETKHDIEYVESLATEVTDEKNMAANVSSCLLYTSPSPRDATLSRMPSSA